MWFGSAPFSVPLAAFIATRRKRFCFIGDPSFTLRLSSGYRVFSFHQFILTAFLRTLRFLRFAWQMGGRYKCTPCNFWCDDNEAMDTHLSGASHRDVVSMMKGSVPVVVGRQRALPCHTCDRRFRYNLQLWLHVKETGHEGSVTATDEYQQRLKCTLCPQIFRSLIALQRHQLNCHPTMKFERFMRGRRNDPVPPGPYFCSFCSLNFSTAQDAVLHRRTSSHKEIVRASKNKQEQPVNMRDCPHCGEKHPNLSEHKKHLLEKHPELCHR